MKNTYISKFKNYRSSIPENVVSLWDWFNDDSLKNEVDFIRTVDNKEDRNRLKANLPGITPSGTFSKRKGDSLVKHSGFICIDIDSGDNPGVTDFANLRDQLKNILNIAYVSLSVSGNGVFCLIPLMFADKHKEHFEALKICFEKIGIIIDTACGDVTRLRGYSYDANAYFNPDAKVFNQYIDYMTIVEQSLPENQYSNTDIKKSESYTKRKVLEIIAQIQNTSTDITERYEQWIQIGCALANEFGEEGRELFHLVSKNHQEYHPVKTDNLFNPLLQNQYSYTIGTFFYWAEKYGLK
ncbi:BT4734/BF3469 family protein [Flavobacterium soyangense]|uniref:PriCT-2 domain-containing protein n=1 Tax=Flavobacterium soyangense TaxID=2023265 RepID=A0A930U5V4_9FLAO|nr:BT4734/BF3469 family protein [Flavobacterium soyangense]MBF2707443.1 PriCT-2 domain-containing protein [Flavobacterium soyangense]